MIARVELSTMSGCKAYSVCDTVVISGEDVCCCVVFGTLVGVSVFSVILGSELLMTSAISCPLWASVYKCQRVECAFTSPVKTGCGMFVMCCLFCSAWMCYLEEVYKCLHTIHRNIIPNYICT